MRLLYFTNGGITCCVNNSRMNWSVGNVLWDNIIHVTRTCATSEYTGSFLSISSNAKFKLATTSIRMSDAYKLCAFPFCMFYRALVVGPRCVFCWLYENYRIITRASEITFSKWFVSDRPPPVARNARHVASSTVSLGREDVRRQRCKIKIREAITQVSHDNLYEIFVRFWYDNDNDKCWNFLCLFLFARPRESQAWQWSSDCLCS